MIAPDFALILSFTALLPPTPPSDGESGRPRLPQAGRSEVVARFQMAGKTHRVSRDEISLFLVLRTRNSSSTKKAIQHLIDVELVRQAATASGMMPSTEDVDAELRRIELQVKKAKQDFDKILAARRLTRETMADQLALGIAQKRLAAKVLRKSTDQVSAKHLELWSRQQRNKVEIITDPRRLPSGVVARVGKGEVTTLDLGRILFIQITPNNLAGLVQEVVMMRMIGHAANQQGIELRPKDFERQFQKTKHRFETSGSSKGVNYEDWLVAMGGSKQKELASPLTRSIMQHERLVRRRHSPTRLDDMLAKDGAALLRRHGGRRSLSILLIRATKNPNKIIKRDFADALRHTKRLRSILTENKKTFAELARNSSDHAPSKAAGGRIGWQHREYQRKSRHQRAPTAVLQAAYGLAIGAVSQPIEDSEGYYLVQVSGIEPTPAKPILHRRMLGELSDAFGLELITAAKIEMLIQ